MPETPRRVLTVAPMPPEKMAYALARYSRSPDSIQDSIEWVRKHDSSKFLDSFYFQYGHASIADLGHLVVCFEHISELAATEIEDEPLWDGQARSSRYQDFARGGFITPPELSGDALKLYQDTAERLLETYRDVHDHCLGALRERLPKPPEMKADVYERNLAARAFDVARYCLFLGVPTGVGQIVSIRTLERQIRRMRASPCAELRDLGSEAAAACAVPPSCGPDDACDEPLAPTLAKYVSADEYPCRARQDLRRWAEQNLPRSSNTRADDVQLDTPSDTLVDIAATLLYPVTSRPFRELLELLSGWGRARVMEVVDTAVRSKSRRDDLLREFRAAGYAFDIVMDIGAYRDLHRHRRCQQFRQEYTAELGFSVPDLLKDAGISAEYNASIGAAHAAAGLLPRPAGDYLLPFATRSRFLFRMDFAEADYIIRLRSGVKGHFSYREIAWKMKETLEKAEPELGKLLQATPPWVEDPLQR